MKFDEFLRRGFDRPLPEPAAEEIRDRVLSDRGRADPGDVRLARRTPWAIRAARSHPRLVAALSFAALGLLAMGALLRLSSDSLPGDPLYAVKRAVEDVRISLKPASFDLRVDLAGRRAEELSRLDAADRLDESSARTLVLSLNDQLAAAHSLCADERLERASEAAFVQVAPILEARRFPESDPAFPLPLVFRKGAGLQPSILDLPTRSFSSTMWGEGNFIYLLVDGRIVKIDARTMKPAH
jgi:hypothetical protein